MKVLSCILNIPWTFLGCFLALISISHNVRIHRSPFSFVFKVKSFWWFSWLSHSKGVRGMALGNVVLLGPKELERDLEHELVHVEQGIREPFIHPFLYYIEMFRKGYKENKYEKEAYERAGNLYSE